MSVTRDATDQRPHFVYRCFTAEADLLYVGCTLDVQERMYHHLQLCNIGKQPNATLQKYMANWTAEEFPTKALARAEEMRLIGTEAPLVNRQHNPKRFRKSSTDRRSYDFVGEVHPISREAFQSLVEWLRTERVGAEAS